MRYCPACQIRYPDDAKVCGECGARLTMGSATIPDTGLSLDGRVLGGNYQIIKLLGKGGMGAVYRARQLSLDREVAIKVLLAPLAMEGEMLERFHREARGASNIGHPGIVQIIDLGYLDEGPPFIAMELLEGEDLRAKLNREGAVPPEQAIPSILQVCDALQAAHDKGIVHRDLKPDNIFLVYRQGKLPLVKILDFGLSKIKSADQKITHTGALIGTPIYMSPEQVKAEVEVDGRADVYACGAILYEMLTGKPPYDGASVQSILVQIMTEVPPTPRSLRPDLPEPLEAVVLRAMAREPEGRYQSAGELAVDLARVGAMVGVSSSQLSLAGFPSASGSGPTRAMPSPAYQSPPDGSPLTPPPTTVSPLPRKGGSPVLKIVLALVIGLVVLAILPLLVGALALGGYFFMGPREKPLVDEDRTVELESLFEEMEEVVEPAPATEDAGADAGGEASHPGHFLGTGTNPWVCCGPRGCGVIYQTEEEETAGLRMLRLDDDGKPKGKVKALTRGEEMGRWPSCFPREDGGFLVLYQEGADAFDYGAAHKIHARVVSPKGKAGKSQTLAVQNMMVVEDYEPLYHAARCGNRVLVVWNTMSGMAYGTKLAVMDMDGNVIKSGEKLHKKMAMNPTRIACNDEQCLVVWTTTAPPMNHVRYFSVVSNEGKILEDEVRAWDRGYMVSELALVPTKNGPALTWVETTKKGNMYQMAALYDWNGKEKVEPARIEVFGNYFYTNQHLRYAAGSPDSPYFAVSRPGTYDDTGYYKGLLVMLDGKVKAKKKKSVAIPDEYVYDSYVFLDQKGKPIMIYSEDSHGSDQEMYVVY